MMNAILVDDEEWGLKRLEMECDKIRDIHVVGKFRSSVKALDFAKENQVDLAFLDIEMPQMSGLELSDKLQEMKPDMISVFVTAHDQYMQEHFTGMEEKYFIIKPYSEKEIMEVMEQIMIHNEREIRMCVN